jgi:hypothetical protein
MHSPSRAAAISHAGAYTSPRTAPSKTSGAARRAAQSQRTPGGGKVAARAAAVFRVSRSLLGKKVTQLRLREMVVAQLLDIPLSDDSTIHQVMAMDVRLNRALLWQSRHIEAFGPRGGISTARRLLRAFQLPGCTRDLQAWLSRAKPGTAQRHTVVKASQRKPLRRVVKKLKLKELFQPTCTQPAQRKPLRRMVRQLKVEERGGLFDSTPGNRRKRPWPQTYEYGKPLSQKPVQVRDVQMRAIGTDISAMFL